MIDLAGSNIIDNPTPQDAAQALRTLAAGIEAGRLTCRRLAMFQGGENGFDMTVTGYVTPQARIG